MNVSTDIEDVKSKNRRTGLIVLGVVIAMITLAYASVPLYKLFCQVTGFGGTTQIAETLPDVVLDRKITVRFHSDTNSGLNWNFSPEVRSITLNIGQEGLINFFAENKSSQPATGVALYNVTPPKAGKYFHKTQCFCFNEQTLQPGEKVNMPVLFFVDPSIADDPNLDEVESITLSYTFFKAETEELDSALEKFYDTE
jgi:cytochrome c oxidase assembly protein subunit 11